MSEDTMPFPARELRLGELVADTYEVRSLLGRGGMGSVYEAWDRHLRRRVAIKISSSWESQYSVGKEGRALAAVKHPCMVTVYAFGVHRELEYLVMERVEGTTLAAHIHERLRVKPFAPDEVIDLLRRIAEGLSAVHDAGISHRDVKPANIMLAPGKLVLMDFGLFLPEFERSDRIAGSPEYIAPEVATQKVLPGQGHLVDLYALGIIGYELLAGSPPFSRATPYAILRHQIADSPPRLETVRSDAPAELVQLVHELLSKSPGDRPESAEYVLWRLRAITERSTHKSPRRTQVLIVDDDPAVREALREAVASGQPDASVVTAGDGESALRMLKRGMPDVLVLDLQLPRMNGLELCMYARGADPAGRCRIISVSGAAQPRDVQVLRDLGVSRHFAKGPELPQLLRRALREL